MGLGSGHELGLGVFVAGLGLNEVQRAKGLVFGQGTQICWATVGGFGVSCNDQQTLCHGFVGEVGNPLVVDVFPDLCRRGGGQQQAQRQGCAAEAQQASDCAQRDDRFKALQNYH